MAESTEDGWEDGTAVAGADYLDAIAKSEPDFENESGTAVAGQNYVENIRKSGDLAASAKAASAAAKPVAPALVARPAPAMRAPTMAFGTPALLRAPAEAPVPERRTPAPLPGLRAPGPVSAIPSMIPVRESRSAPTRKPAPSGFVDQPFGAGERPSGGTPNAATAAATPVAKDRASAGVPPVAAPSADRSGGLAKPFVAEERGSGRISALMPQQERGGRYSNPPPRASDVDAGFDDGAEDDSAGDLEAFDHAETMGQPQRDSSPVVEQRVPAPLRPSPTPAPMRSVQAAYEPSTDPYQARAASPDPAPAAAQPNLPQQHPHSLPQQHPQYAPMPTDYRMVAADEMQAFRSPLSSPMIQAPAPAPRVAAPKARVVLIAVSIAVVIALAVGGYLIFSGNDEPTTTAATTAPATKPAKPATPDEGKPATVATAPQPPASEVATPPKSTPTTAAKATTSAKPTPAIAAKPTPATAAKPTPATPTKTATKPAIAKTAAKPATKTVKKVVKTPVRTAPVRRKVPVKPAAKCSGLECL